MEGAFQKRFMERFAAKKIPAKKVGIIAFIILYIFNAKAQGRKERNLKPGGLATLH